MFCASFWSKKCQRGLIMLILIRCNCLAAHWRKLFKSQLVDSPLCKTNAWKKVIISWPRDMDTLLLTSLLPCSLQHANFWVASWLARCISSVSLSAVQYPFQQARMIGKQAFLFCPHMHDTRACHLEIWLQPEKIWKIYNVLNSFQLIAILPMHLIFNWEQ